MQTLFADAVWSLFGQGGEQPGMYGMILPVLMIGALFYFMLILPQRREQKRMKGMLDALKKNDRVITSGGIWGVVVNVQKDFVTIKIDESSNSKLKVVRSSISRVLTEDDEVEKSDKDTKK